MFCPYRIPASFSDVTSCAITRCRCSRNYINYKTCGVYINGKNI